MSFFNNLTGMGKAVFGLVLVLLLGGAIYFGMGSLKKNGKLDSLKKDVVSGDLAINEDADVVIGYNTFIGASGLLYMNGGLEPNADSKLFKKYGLKVQIKIMDDVSKSRDALKTGAIDAVYCTIDALPIELGDGSTLIESGAKVRMKINESRGADVIVVAKGINSVQDLKGKTVAVAIGTASHTLLLNSLSAANMSMKDIEIKSVSDGGKASAAFKSHAVDAAVVWSPDDEDCIKAVNGSKVLLSTKTATSIIADGLLITDSKLEQNKENIVKLMKAWMEGNAILNENGAARVEAADLFAKYFSFPKDVAEATVDKVRYSTLGDNKAFFGLESTFTGVTGDKMYTRMAVKYSAPENESLAKSPVSWNKASDESLIDEISKDNSFASDESQSLEKEIVFKAPTKQEETMTSASSKNVTINFATASSVLDEHAQNIIDKEIFDIAESFGKAKIRVEGNTDNTGDVKSNILLSKKRAQAVVKYLVDEHGIAPNKFVVVGNGQNKPLCTDNTPECLARNRRTDFELLIIEE